MTTLLLKFRIDFWRPDGIFAIEHQWPVFHRWLPDGEKDALSFDMKDPNIALKIWFERWGVVQSGLIEYRGEKREFDPAIIPTQGYLVGGPLFGLLIIDNISDENIDFLQENKNSDQSYINLGKRVVQDLICPQVSRFIKILRIKYGQYWLQQFEGWDSRVVDIGTYCQNTLRLQWSIDAGVTWSPFVPKPKDQYVAMTCTSPSVARLRQYLTEEDWYDLARIMREGNELSLASTVLAQTHRLMDQERWKEALIEGNTALELAIDESIRNRLGNDKTLLNQLTARFNDLPLRIKIISIGTFIDQIPLTDINHTIKAIDMRNKVVHEGWEPTTSNDVRVALSGLIRLVMLLLPDLVSKFPSAKLGNQIMPVADWEKEA
jgi:hypothetical protein